MRALGWILLLVAAGTAGCKSNGNVTAGPSGPGPGAEPRTDELCVSSECGEAVRLVDIPDAENILFSDDGRLFVTGGTNIYEVTAGADAFVATPLADADCGFTGMAIRKGYLYATCGDSRFFAGRLTATPTLTEIFQFEGMCIPNGTALGPDGRIYVVDEPLDCPVPDPKIVRLTIDPNNPMKVKSQENWIVGSPAGLLWVGQDNVFRFPNGLVRDGNTLYGTDGGSVYSVSISNKGEPGEVTPLFFEPTAHDDLGLAGPDGLVVTDFFAGRILLLSRDGELLQATDEGTFLQPSSARLGRPPMFKATDVLVTEKGMIGEQNIPIDFLTLFRRRPE